MGRTLLRIFVVLVLLAAGAVAAWRYTRPAPIEVRLTQVERGTVERTVANTRAGTLTACRRAKLSPSIGGQIAELNVREGDRVKTGQLLLALWNRDLHAELTLAESEAVTAQTRIRAACAQAEIAQRDADRQKRLEQSGSAALERVDRAVTEAGVRRAECDAAKSALITAHDRARLARVQMERTRLLAPFDGIVAEVNGERGEYLTPSPPGIPTPPAVDLVDDSCFYVTAPIDEVDAPAIQVGMPARIGLDAFGKRRFEGRVRRIGAYVLDREKQARTVDVEVEFVRPQEIAGLLAGYSADAEVVLDVRREVLRVPAQAVIEGRQVYRLSPATGHVEKRGFEPGISNWDFVEVRSGLEAGDQLVLSVDAKGLAEGVLVRAAPPEQP